MRRLWSFQPVLGVSKPGCLSLLRLLLRAQVPRETHLPCEMLEAGNLDTGAANHGSINLQLWSKQVNKGNKKKMKTKLKVSFLKTASLRNLYLFSIFINVLP